MKNVCATDAAMKHSSIAPHFYISTSLRQTHFVSGTSPSCFFHKPQLFPAFTPPKAGLLPQTVSPSFAAACRCNKIRPIRHQYRLSLLSTVLS